MFCEVLTQDKSITHRHTDMGIYSVCSNKVKEKWLGLFYLGKTNLLVKNLQPNEFTPKTNRGVGSCR